jgi:hypothetical protein
MVEFKIQLEENFVKTFGQEEIEKQLQDFTKRLILKSAARDILEDLKNFDLQNDKEWQTARNLAWQQEKHKYIFSK